MAPLAASLFLYILLSSRALTCAGERREDLLIGYRERSSTQIGRVIIETESGTIPIRLLPKNAPQTTTSVIELALRKGPCATCKFYRNEARPQAGELGPPYGLLQGSLAEIAGLPPREGNYVARTAHACMIPGTKEFFIALSDHSEWGTAHTVWGEVENMDAVEAIVKGTFHEITHPDYGTKMRMLDAEVPFSISVPVSSSL